MPYKVTFRPNRAGIQAAGNSSAIFRKLERRADRVIEIARANAPVGKDRISDDDSSVDAVHYRDSFKKERTRVRGQAAIKVYNDSPHADYIESGTRPHVIEARNAKALVLAWRQASGQESQPSGNARVPCPTQRTAGGRQMTGYGDPELLVGSWLQTTLGGGVKVWMDRSHLPTGGSPRRGRGCNAGRVACGLVCRWTTCCSTATPTQQTLIHARALVSRCGRR